MNIVEALTLAGSQNLYVCREGRRFVKIEANNGCRTHRLFTPRTTETGRTGLNIGNAWEPSGDDLIADDWEVVTLMQD